MEYKEFFRKISLKIKTLVRTLIEIESKSISILIVNTLFIILAPLLFILERVNLIGCRDLEENSLLLRIFAIYRK